VNFKKENCCWVDIFQGTIAHGNGRKTSGNAQVIVQLGKTAASKLNPPVRLLSFVPENILRCLNLTSAPLTFFA